MKVPAEKCCSLAGDAPRSSCGKKLLPVLQRLYAISLAIHSRREFQRGAQGETQRSFPKMNTQQLLATLSMFTVSCGIIHEAAAQWPHFGGANRDFRASRDLESPEAEVHDWSIELGVGDSPPIVVQNKVFVTEYGSTDDGQEALQIRCIDLINGVDCWKTTVQERSYVSQDISDRFPVRPLASPVASGKWVVVVSFGGCVACLDQQTGDVAWQHDLVGEFQATPLQFGWASSPWIDGNHVILACGGPESLVIAIELDSGGLAWKTGSGEAAFGSFAEVRLSDDSTHLCYIGRDTLIGFDPRNGTKLWDFPLPDPGLTNTVTPISLPDGHLLVAGQGFDSCQRIEIKRDGDLYHVNKIWESRHSPFYCNWITDAATNQIFGYNSNVLGGMSLSTGELNWKSRGWTDANFAVLEDVVVGIRGDGFLAVSKLTSEGMEVQSGTRVVSDRVWVPPVVVGKTALIRGRTSLSAVDLTRLPALDRLPTGTQVDSMNAMYGAQHESIVALNEKENADPTSTRFDDYLAIVSDRSIPFGEQEYKSLFDALSEVKADDLAIRIAQDWISRQPESIVAFDRLNNLYRSIGDDSSADQAQRDRAVDIVINANVPKSTGPNAEVYLAGNASSLGAWKPDGVLMTRLDDGHYQARFSVPKGNLEFKVTRGDWESVELRSDGRSISNRRQRVSQPMTIRIEVQAWKNRVDQ